MGKIDFNEVKVIDPLGGRKRQAEREKAKEKAGELTPAEIRGHLRERQTELTTQGVELNNVNRRLDAVEARTLELEKENRAKVKRPETKRKK